MDTVIYWFESLKDIVFKSDASIYELIFVIAAIGVFWAIFFTVIPMFVTPFVYGKPWLKSACEREFERVSKEELAVLWGNPDKQGYVDIMMSSWAQHMCICTQHIVGGSLCLPSVLNFMETDYASSLACLGLLSESGWEIQDLINLTYVRYFTKGGKGKVTYGMYIGTAIHHTLALVLGLPMCLNYKTNKTLHQLCLSLQFAGGILIFLVEYSKLLDVSISSQLNQFRFINFVSMVIMVVSRVFTWVYLVGKLMITFYTDEAWSFLIVSSLVCGIFSLFNFLMVKSSYARFIKFEKGAVAHKALPKTVSAHALRSSLIALEGIAQEIQNANMGQDFADLFQPRQIDRSQSVPPSFLMNRNRSIMMLRAASVSLDGSDRKWK